MSVFLQPNRPLPKNDVRLVKCLCIAIVLIAISLGGCVLSQTPVATIPSSPTSQLGNQPQGSGNITGGTEPGQVLLPTPTSRATSLPTFTASSPTPTPVPSPTSVEPVVFAAIGDYGTGNNDEEAVASLILGWQPDFVITLGDNNYPSGKAEHIDIAVGQYFHSFIYPYLGSFGMGSDINRFFPSLGNHDVITDHGQPYFDYFSLPGNERYYDFTWGPLHFFALDNIETEPDGVGVSSTQAEWLKAGLVASTSVWNIVYMHYPPYSSGIHGSTDWALWPYADWGADAVLAGHDHTYERLEEDGLVYFVNGLGGGGRYDFNEILDGSQVRYNRDYGAMRVEATETSLVFQFITRTGEVIDTYELDR
jgi:tartrate-resistant acid phosphatase type 5